jgi:energy-coupling factor transport system permease protein
MAMMASFLVGVNLCPSLPANILVTCTDLLPNLPQSYYIINRTGLSYWKETGMTGIKLGQYVHGDSLLPRLDPRTKIICCTLIVVAIIINDRWYSLLFFALLMAAAIRASGMDIRFVLGSLRSIRSLLLVTFVFMAVLTPGQAVWTWGVLHVTREGLTMGAVNLLRLIILYLGSMVLLMTTSPMQLAAGIDWLLLPLSRLKLPVHHFSTILSISFRFIPTLIDQAVLIQDAQRSRGAQFASPRLGIRLKSYLAILIPLFEASLLRAEDLGEAMDSRCFTGHPNQLRLDRLHFHAADGYVLISMLGLLAAGILFPVLL